MHLDRRNRRLRYAGPQPGNRSICLTDRDLAIFEALDRHGPLPTHYLHVLTRHLARDRTRLAKRLTALYHHGWLTRPPQQWHARDWRCQPIVYDLTNQAREVLGNGESGWSTPRTDPMAHRLMTATITASLELAATQAGHRFIPLSEIMAHTSCPQQTREARNPLRIAVGQTVIVPDALFGIQYANGRYRFFALEADRGTENITQSGRRGNAVSRKIDGYAQAHTAGAFQAQWGVPNLCVLTATTSRLRAQHMLADLRQRANGDRNALGMFLFTHRDEFGPLWAVPPIMTALFDTPWERIGDSVDISRS